MAAPFRALPPGVYFNPTAEECVRDYLKPWAAGVPPATDRVICDVDAYSDSPAALLQGRKPGFSRGFDHKWLLLSRCSGCGKTAAGRGKREVATGGRWQSEQKPQGVVGAADGEDGEEDEDEQPAGGRRRSFGFYVGENGNPVRKGKTPWLMEEFTAVEDGHGGADGTFVVFCKIYLSPRLENEDREKKRQILGDDMVAFDRHGKMKLVRVLVSPELFDAVAQQQGPLPPPPPLRVLGFQQAQPARCVLGHQQGQPPSPATRFLGYQQVQPGAPALRRFLGLQHGQAAATPAVLGDHHGRALPVPTHHDGQAMLPWGVPAHYHGHAAAAAAPHQGVLGYLQGQASPRQLQGGTAVQPQLLHVLDPCSNQEASPSVVAGGHYNGPTVRLVDPQQGEAMTHTEKKPRLAYGSPTPHPLSSDSPASSCLVHVSPSQEQGVVIQIHDGNQCSAEPVAPTPPPQEIPGTATAGPAEAEPPCDALAPAPAELDDDEKAGAELMLDPGIYVNLADFVPLSDAMPDSLAHGEFNPLPLYDDDGEFNPLPLYYNDPAPLPGFDEFQLVDLFNYNSV